MAKKKRADGTGKVVKTCEFCGKKFEIYACWVEKGGGRFCSTKCRDMQKHKGGTEIRICPICGKKTKRIKSDPRTYCSNKCQGIASSTKVEVKCLHCGKIFNVVPARLKDGGGKYCSKKCFNNHKKLSRPKTICMTCGKEFSMYPSQKGKKYCSMECRLKRTTDEKGKKIASVNRLCEMCGKSFVVKYPSDKRRYCSRKCASLRLKLNGYGYDAAFKRLSWIEDIRRDPKDKRVAQFRCYTCKEWFTPTRGQVSDRIKAIERENPRGELHLYCSDACKNSCSIYKRVSHFSFEDKDTRNEVLDPQIRQIALDRDNHQCQKCGSLEDLEVHHIEGVAREPMLANDIDNLLTVCHNCHKEIHFQIGCTYHDYQRASCENTIKEITNNT